MAKKKGVRIGGRRTKAQTTSSRLARLEERFEALSVLVASAFIAVQALARLPLPFVVKPVPDREVIAALRRAQGRKR